MRYPLTALLAVAVCAVLGGASSFAAITDWLHDLDEQTRTRLGFTRGAPVGTTVWRLLTRLDAELLTTALAGWLHTRGRPATATPRRYRTVVAVDGKTLRGARRPTGGQVHLLSALDTSTGVVLAQVTVDAKSNEIPAFAPLLDAARTGTGPAVIATLRNTAIGYHRTSNAPNIARATRHANRRSHDLINAVTSSYPTTQ